MIAKFLTFLALVAFSSAGIFPCSDDVPLPSKVAITGCDVYSAARCKLVRGNDVTGVFDFIAHAGSKSLRPDVVATAFGIRARFDLPEETQDACEHLIGSQCPLDKGEDATWQFQMPVTNEYPLVELLIEVTLYGDNNAPLFCAGIEAVTVD